MGDVSRFGLHKEDIDIVLYDKDQDLYYLAMVQRQDPTPTT